MYKMYKTYEIYKYTKVLKHQKWQICWANVLACVIRKPFRPLINALTNEPPVRGTGGDTDSFLSKRVGDGVRHQKINSSVMND